MENIAKALNGTMLVRVDDPHLNGKVSMAAANRYGVSRYEVRDRIVIVGDDDALQEDLIRKGAGLLVWCQSVDPEVQKLAAEAGCPIILSGHGAMKTSRYLYLSILVELVMQPDVKAFRKTAIVQDVLERMKEVRFRSFPVVEEENRVVGFVEQ